ncbi:MAG: hypothetical protein GXP46_08265, partial [Deferribacteres bacterium]|nr:hypothetical protein [Deferribacteres bacterium]
AYFDINRRYEAEVVLNRGTDVEVRGERKDLKIIPVEFDVYPDEETIVSADEASVYIVASISVGTDTEGLPIPAEDGSIVEWFIDEGTGTLSEQQSLTRDGFAVVTLNTTTTPGDTYRVGAKVKSLVVDGRSYEIGGVSAVTNTIRVVPGKAADITISKSKASYAADETDAITLTAVVKDRYGNLVEDGSPVYWGLEGLGEFPEEEIVEETLNGQAQATVKPGFLAEAQEIEVQADGYEQPETIDVTAVEITLTSDRRVLDVYLKEKARLTATFKDSKGNSIADGTRVTWFASNGKITGDTVVSNGIARAVLDTAGGRIENTLVSVAAGNFVKSLRIPFISGAPTRMEVEHPVIAGDATEDGTLGIEQLNGSIAQIPYYAKTRIAISGAPGAVATLWTTAMLPVSSYPFEEITAGTVTDAAGGNNGTVKGAVLDTENFANGTASLSFDGDDTVVIPDDASLHIENGLAVSAWVRPTATGESTLVQKEGEYRLAITPEGRVSFTVITGEGTYTVKSTVALTRGYWYRVKGVFEEGNVSVTVNTLTAKVPAAGDIVPGASPVVIGESFAGNMDSVVIYREQRGAGGLVRLSGVDENGQVQLDSSGQAVVLMESTGILSADSFGEEIDIHVIASPETRKEVKVVSKRWYTRLYNLGRGFVWGDGEGVEGLAGDFAAGMAFGIGDARDILKNVGYLWPGGKEPDWVQFGFAVAGLATEFVPLAGEAPDAVITGTKVILPKVGKGVFRTSLVRIVKRMFKIGWEEGPKAGIKYAEEYAGLLKAIVTRGDETITAFNAFVRSSRTIERAARLQKVMGDEVIDVLVSITNNAELGPKVANKVALTLGRGVDDAVLQGIKDSGRMSEALEGLAKVLKNRVNPGEIKRALANSNLYSAGYKEADLLVDMGEVAQVKGLDYLVKTLKQSASQVKGRRYELEVAAWLKRNNYEVVEFSQRISKRIASGTKLEGTDIDVVIKNAQGELVYLQVKNGTAAFRYGREGLEKERLWVKKAMTDLNTQDFKRVQYVVPPGTRIPPMVDRWFRKTGIDVLDFIPYGG